MSAFNSNRAMKKVMSIAIILSLLILGLTGCAKKYTAIGLGTKGNPVVLEVVQQHQIIEVLDQSRTHVTLKPGEYCFQAYNLNDPTKMPISVPGCVDSSTPFQVYLHDGASIKLTVKNK